MRTASGRLKTIDNPESEWVILDDAHEAIVQPEIWQRAQEAVKKRSHYQGGLGKKNVYLLAGMMRCTHCGKLYWGFKKQSGKKSNGKTVQKYYYACSGYHASGRHTCVSAHVPADDYEGWLLGQIKALVFAQGQTVENVVERFVQEILATQQQDDTGRRLKEIDTGKARIRQSVDALLSNIEPENMALINSKLSDLRRQLAELDAEAKQLKAEAPKTVDAASLRKFAYEKLSRLQETVTGYGDTVRTRQVLEGYVAKIEVNPQEKCIETYLYRDALPFLPKELLEETGEGSASLTAAATNTATKSGTTKPEAREDLNRKKCCKAIEKPELAFANPGFSRYGRGDRI